MRDIEIEMDSIISEDGMITVKHLKELLAKVDDNCIFCPVNEFGQTLPFNAVYLTKWTAYQIMHKELQPKQHNIVNLCFKNNF